ncbi:MAG: hypothetical protein ACP5US_05550 [Candidatus Kryptoniota bacterium]
MKRYLFLLFAGLAYGCSKGSLYPSQPSSPPTTQTVSFQINVQPIFTANCATSGCHINPGAQQGLDLSTGNAYASIVNVPSHENHLYYRVKPSNSDSSYLYMKIIGAPGITGARMPYSRPQLSQTDIQTIQEWINQGAKNN